MNDVSTFEIQEGDEFRPSEDGDLEPAFACSSCGTELAGVFYEVNDAPFCEPCSAVVYQQFLGRDTWNASPARPCSGWWPLSSVRSVCVRGPVDGQAFALLAVLVGLMVGRAVRSGCGGRGGLSYQFLAVFLTYSAIVSATIPRLLDMVRQNQARQMAMQAPLRPNNNRPPNVPGRFAPRPRPPRVVFGRMLRGFFLGALIVCLAYLLPLLIAMKQPWMLLVIAFGLWEAWKINRKPVMRMTGPFYLEKTTSNPTRKPWPSHRVHAMRQSLTCRK